METFIFSLVAFCVIMFLLAIGLIVSGKVLKKGCNINPDEECPICHKTADEQCLNKEE